VKPTFAVTTLKAHLSRCGKASDAALAQFTKMKQSTTSIGILVSRSYLSCRPASAATDRAHRFGNVLFLKSMKKYIQNVRQHVYLLQDQQGIRSRCRNKNQKQQNIRESHPYCKIAFK
jgi:hypothetical protein